MFRAECAHTHTTHPNQPSENGFTRDAADQFVWCLLPTRSTQPSTVLCSHNNRWYS